MRSAPLLVALFCRESLAAVSGRNDANDDDEGDDDDDDNNDGNVAVVVIVAAFVVAVNVGVDTRCRLPSDAIRSTEPYASSGNVTNSLLRAAADAAM